jgi:SAM-dependent methyltransferase
MDPNTANLLYRRPELYELLYPEKDEATPRLCLRLFERYGVSPTSILDIGCGTARDLNILSRRYPDCHGIDLLPENISYARSIRPHLHLSVGDMRSVRLAKTFDVIVSFGSAILYALENHEIEATLQTFAAHARPGTFLILDLLNAACFLPGGAGTMQREFEINVPEFSAKAVAIHSFDRAAQHLIRERTWHITGEESVKDYCRYRMFFPADLRHWLNLYSFDVLGIWDNKELEPSELTNPTLYVAARFQGSASKSSS